MSLISQNISQKNDQLRKRIPLVPMSNQFMMTNFVTSLPEKQLLSLFSKVANFNDLNEDNNPHEEHDSFGVIDGQKYFLKIDYYDEDLEFYQEDGVRVITLMQASDY